MYAYMSCQHMYITVRVDTVYYYRDRIAKGVFAFAWTCKELMQHHADV